MSMSRSQRRRQGVRSPARRPSSSVASRPSASPPDYSLDYAYVRRDLLRILLVGGLLFAAMIAVSFVI